MKLFVKQKERDYAADQSAKVTEAYRTLTKRLSRAMYIVSSSLTSYNAVVDNWFGEI